MSFTQLTATAQDQDRFELEIAAFEEEDAKDGDQQNFVLFVGSSSIRLWTAMEDDMAGIPFLNRGFGGATMRELNEYWPRILARHKPSLVVVYCGENDISEGASVAETVSQIRSFFEVTTMTLPNIPVIYIAMKPSIDRWELWENFQEADREVKKLTSYNSDIHFVDLGTTMFQDGELKQDIFIEDGLHMNEAGYDGWTSKLRPLIESKLK